MKPQWTYFPVPPRLISAATSGLKTIYSFLLARDPAITRSSQRAPVVSATSISFSLLAPRRLDSNGNMLLRGRSTLEGPTSAGRISLCGGTGPWHVRPQLAAGASERNQVDPP